MSPSLQTLHRLREHARKDSESKLRRAEALREEQQARLDAVQEAVVQARANRDPADALSLANYHAFVLLQRVAERRETAKLQQRDREAEAARTVHRSRVRDELAIQNAIEAANDREMVEERRDETRTLDEVGARMRRVA
jgi:hypothetical protein